MDRSILEGLDLKHFEKLCRAFFDQMGFIARPSGSGAEKGLSELNVLYNKSSEQPFSIFQCADGQGKVDSLVLARFKEKMDQANFKNGYFLTTTVFDPTAINYASRNNINMIDSEKFTELAGKLSADSQNLLREVARTVAPDADTEESEDEDRKVSPHFCPKCGTRMHLKVSDEGKYKTGKYWQCPMFDCGHITAFI